MPQPSSSADPHFLATDTRTRSQRKPTKSFDPTTTIPSAQTVSGAGEQLQTEQPDLSQGYRENWGTYASGSTSHATPSQRTNDQTSAVQHQRPSSMIGPPPMFYDPDQVNAYQQPEAPSYQQWVDSYAQQQSQYDFSTTTAIPSNAVQIAYQVHTQPQHLQGGSAPVTDMSSGALQPPLQNQHLHHFDTATYMPSVNPQQNAYNDQLSQGRSRNTIQTMALGISRPAQQTGHPTSVRYASAPQQLPVAQTSLRQQPSQQMSSQPMLPQQIHPQHVPSRPIASHHIPSTSVAHSEYQQYVPQQHGDSTETYMYSEVPSSEFVADSCNQQSHQGFTFQYPPPSEHLSATNLKYTPSPDLGNPHSSMSPSSLAGTDDTHHSYPSGPSPQPTPSISSSQKASTSTVRRTLPSQTTGKRERGPSRNTGDKGNKRPRAHSDIGSDDEEGTTNSTVPPLKGPDSTPTRPAGACTHCKKLKMKCDFSGGENTCKRCKQTGHPCIVEGRKPRNAPNKREYLLAQIRQKDAIIESLLKQLHNPYLATPLSIAAYRMATSPSDRNNSNVLAWLDRLTASVRTAGSPGGAKAFKLDARARRSGELGYDSDEYSDGDEGIDPTERGHVVGQQESDEVKVEEDDKLQLLPDDAPLGLIANLSLDNTKKSPSRNDDGEEDDDDVGVANKTYFLPGPAYDYGIRANLIEQHSPPDILVHNLVTPDDVDKLFAIFYERLNVHVSLLDPVIHTASSTFARCPFLFTVICAVAARYYTEKSEIYPIAMHFAKHAAANALITGWKSVELAQAYILMSIYAVPARRWEEDRSWLYTGLAIRLATDLNLHQVSTAKPTSEQNEREILNKTRVWMICYNLDRSTATQYGKPSTIKEDYIVRNSADWYKKSKYNDRYDVGLCAYNSLLRVMAHFHDEVYSDPDSPSGLNQHLDFHDVTTRHDQALTANHDEWKTRFQQDSDMTDPGIAFRGELLPFLTHYSRLVMYSFGFQQAYRRGMQPRDHIFLDKCFESAKGVISSFVECLAPTGFMRYSPDGHFIFATFASAFLLKLLKSKETLITKTQEGEIFDLIGSLIKTLYSQEIAIDDRHTPRLHARFLAGLLSKHRRDVATTGRIHPRHPPQGQTATTQSPSPGPFAVQEQGAQGMTTSGQQVFSAAGPSQGQTHSQQQAQDQGNSHRLHHPQPAPPSHPLPEQMATSEPIYEEETTYAFGTNPVDTNVHNGIDDEMLGPLQILKQPAYWETMMMPGFQWPERVSSNSFGADAAMYHQGIPGINTGFAMPVAQYS